MVLASPSGGVIRSGSVFIFSFGNEIVPVEPSILARPSGATIAYHHLSGKGPGVIFCTGFKSDMTGGKALALETWCRTEARQFTRFDYQGHGASSGRFEDGTIGQWREDALAVLDEVTSGPQVVVGSSMGGWIACLMAVARPNAFGPSSVSPRLWTSHKHCFGRASMRTHAGRSRRRACGCGPPFTMMAPIRLPKR